MIEDELLSERDEASIAEAVARRPARRRLWRARRQAHSKAKRSRRRVIVETTIGLLVALLLALGVRTFVFHVFYVPSGSMEPTLAVGDRILVNKFLFNWHSVHPGSIIVFRTPPAAISRCATTDGDLVKRVVATGGQTIWSRGNVVYVNGEPLPQPYLPKGTQLGQPITRTIVPKSDVYVLGDNRSVSCDSRVWGPVPGTSIVGSVVAIVWESWHPDVHFF